MIGSAVGPHPYPMIVRDFQSVIGGEAREQMLDEAGRLPGDRGGLRRRRLQRHRACSIPSCDDEASSWSASRRAARARRRPARAPRSGWRPGRAARLALLRAAGRRRPDRRGALDLGRARLPRRRPGARPPADSGRARYAAHRRRGARRLPALLPSRRASSRRSSPPTRSPSWAARRRALGAGRVVWSASRAGATRTSTRPRGPGARCLTGRPGSRRPSAGRAGRSSSPTPWAATRTRTPAPRTRPCWPGTRT